MTTQQPPQIEQLLTLLSRAGVEFILVGGVAAVIHGAARATFDVDVVYFRSRENIQRLVSVLAPLSPYLRGAPPGLPFAWTESMVGKGQNFTLTTTLGDLDLLGHVTGGGTYENLLPHSITIEAFGHVLRCVGLAKLIELKKAAGRPKDLEAIAELESLRDESPDV